jgi:hypothetical protein
VYDASSSNTSPVAIAFLYCSHADAEQFVQRPLAPVRDLQVELAGDAPADPVPAQVNVVLVGA